MNEKLPMPGSGRAADVRQRRGTAVLLCVLALAACSQRQVYDTIQNNQQLECQKLPGTQYEECMKQVSEPYDDYKRERDELVKEKPP
ncbi:MAG: hypothetical protein H6984_13770 [Pseudomonadales bacterium]|nr:hypothetical protein [Pseudomonadales bacterium]MCP5193645.1 hypothetical protein [Pseudomonadales bacterium]